MRRFLIVLALLTVVSGARADPTVVATWSDNQKTMNVPPGGILVVKLPLTPPGARPPAGKTCTWVLGDIDTRVLTPTGEYPEGNRHILILKALEPGSTPLELDWTWMETTYHRHQPALKQFVITVNVAKP